jgi:hypothetical protein
LENEFVYKNKLNTIGGFMLKKLTTNTVSQEKKEITERNANFCDPRICLTYCGSLRDVYGENRYGLYANNM